MRNKRNKKMLAMALASATLLSVNVFAQDSTVETSSSATENLERNGGGYAISNQLSDVGYASELYDATNGLPTSDANCILAASDGYMWIGSYGGIIKFDGSTFERQDSSDGLTNGRALFEDSKGRIWVGTNDNGIVVIEDGKNTQITYKEGLPASTIRAFAEDDNGNIYAGTTSGVCQITDDYDVTIVDDSALKDNYVTHLFSDSKGRILGNTRDGDIFVIDDGSITNSYSSADLIDGTTSVIYPDMEAEDMFYIGSDNGILYYGNLSKNFADLQVIDLSEYVTRITTITFVCNRLWIVSDECVGYLDAKNNFHKLENIPLDSAIEMITSDYQGNLWIASSRQGVAKIVTSNFQNVTDLAGIEPQVVNSTCLFHDNIYIGTDKGLEIVDKKYQRIENELTEMLADTRIRCLKTDDKNNLWISTYTNGFGLICYSDSGEMTFYNRESGFISDGIRCTDLTDDGTILVGTNDGVALIKNGNVVDTINAADGLENEVCLTVEEGTNGQIFIGTDGGGLFLYSNGELSKLGRDDGLTSDVILRVKKDEAHGVDWIITSNSIEYMQDREIYNVKTFPYNNNFDIFEDSNDNYWILSSYGIFCVDSKSMLEDRITDYALYNSATGLTSIPTANAFSAIDDSGNLYVSGRSGVNLVNINKFFKQTSEIKIGIKEIEYDNTIVEPDKNGVYVIPADAGRVFMKPAILNYTLSDPLVRIYLEGDSKSGITDYQSELGNLEYTSLSYGTYNLHLQILDENSENIYQDSVYTIEKKPHLSELVIVKLLIGVIIALLIALFVWRIMTNTVIRRQYKEIQAAKEEADRANSAKSRFFANMSREIITPINIILGMDEIILRESADGDLKNYQTTVVSHAKDIRSAAETLLGLINNIFDMSNVESGQINFEEQNIVDASKTDDFVSYEPLFVAPDASVLVVDDNEMNLTVVQGLLKATRVFVATATSGEDCLEKLKYGEYDVVFIEHLMPNMDGIETVEKIRAKHPDLPVYAFTANSMSEEDDFFTSKGFTGSVTKPVDGRELEKIIRKHLSDDVVME